MILLFAAVGVMLFLAGVASTNWVYGRKRSEAARKANATRKRNKAATENTLL